jgi:hypothetical protein
MSMEPTDAQREQLREIGGHGKRAEQLEKLGIDAQLFLRNGWIFTYRMKQGETVAHGTPSAPDLISYHLTDQGAKLAGIDPRELPTLY